VDSKGRIIIHWGKIWESFPHYSVTDVLSDKPDASRADRYKDKIVIIGVVATGTTEFGVSPVSINTPLNRIHSNLLNTILMNNFITPINPFPYLVALSVILTVLFSLTSGWLRLRNAIILAFAVVILTVSGSIALFTSLSYELPITEFLFVFMPGMLAGIIVRITTLELQAARASKAVERYLSPELLEHIVEEGMDLDLSTKRTELTIMFVDVEGFSTISETVDVEYINRLLNDFFEEMTQAIFQHRGTVDKFLGDGLLAFFGNPVPLENHAQAALRAALEMQKSMVKLNAELSQWGISELEKGISIRIGINTGLVIVGNIGSARRLEYTVLGSAVNIASRLQSLAPSGGIIMTARTHSLARDHVACEGPDHVKVKGIDKAIEVFRIYPDAIERYHEEVSP
jgi:adenylate cyclase